MLLLSKLERTSYFEYEGEEYPVKYNAALMTPENLDGWTRLVSGVDDADEEEEVELGPEPDEDDPERGAWLTEAAKQARERQRRDLARPFEQRDLWKMAKLLETVKADPDLHRDEDAEGRSVEPYKVALTAENVRDGLFPTRLVLPIFRAVFVDFRPKPTTLPASNSG